MWQLPSCTLSALISISDYHEYMQEHVFVRITSQSSSVCLHFTFSVELIYHLLHWQKVMCVVGFFLWPVSTLYKLRNPWGNVIWDFGLKIDLKWFWLDFLEMLCKLCKQIPCVLDSMCKCNIVQCSDSNTGAPQRTVLSMFLFTRFTLDFIYHRVLQIVEVNRVWLVRRQMSTSILNIYCRCLIYHLLP